MASEEKSEKVLSVVLGEETNTIQFPGSDKKYRVHPLTVLDLGKLEDYIGVNINEWANDNGRILGKINNMSYIIYLSLKHNELFTMSLEEMASSFPVKELGSVGVIVSKIMILSGIYEEEPKRGTKKKTAKN